MRSANGIGAGGGAGPGAYLAVLVGLMALSVGTVYQKRHASNVDLRSGLALQHLAAAVPLLPFAFHEGLRFDASGEFFASLGWIIGVNSLGAFALLFVLLRRGAVNQVATLFFLMPPATAVMDYFVLGDELTALKVAGVVIAALGVFLATRPPPAAAALRTSGTARRMRQLTARAQRPADEQAPQLLAAVHQRQAPLRQRGERTCAVGKQAVERVDRHAHERDLALAPALVGAQHRERARILAPRHRLRDELREAAASSSPRFTPCPASGCTTCAASPISATRGAT